jgi:hypothetical protein
MAKIKIVFKEHPVTFSTENIFEAQFRPLSTFQDHNEVCGMYLKFLKKGDSSRGNHQKSLIPLKI